VNFKYTFSQAEMTQRKCEKPTNTGARRQLFVVVRPRKGYAWGNGMVHYPNHKVNIKF